MGRTKPVKVLDLLKKGVEDDVEILLLNGDDDYLHELVTKKLDSLYVDPDFRDFNFRKMDCNRSVTAGALNAVLSELPTLVDRRLVVLQRVSQLGKSASQQLAESWEHNLAPGTVLVVTAGGRIKGEPFWESLSKKGLLVDCRLADSEVDVLLKSFCRQRKRKASPQAISLLRERVGTNLRSLLSHLERSLLSLSEGESLTPEVVEKLVPFSAEVAMWKMTSAIGKRNHREALSILDRQLDRGEQPGSIMGYLNSYLTSLTQVRGLMKIHGNVAEVARAIPRKKEYQVKKTVEELRTWSAKDLTDGFDALTRADFKSKGGDGGGDPKLLLQMLVLKLCSRKRVSR